MVSMVTTAYTHAHHFACTTHVIDKLENAVVDALVEYKVSIAHKVSFFH